MVKIEELNRVDQSGSSERVVRFRWLTRERLLVGLVIYLVLYLVGLSVFKFIGSRDAVAIYGSFWESGRAAGLGKDPFLLYPGVWSPPKLPVVVHEVNLNAPAALPFFHFISLFPRALGAGFFTIISGGLYLVSIFRLAQVIRLSLYQVAWLLVSHVTLAGFAIGQTYALMFVLSTSTWLLLKDKRQLAAGIVMGVFIAFKPNFGMWCAVMLLTGHWRPAIIAGVVAALLSILPVVLYGPDLYLQWKAAVALDNHGLIFPNDVSLYGYFSRLGFPAVAKFLPILVGAAGLFIAWWRRPEWSDAFAMGILLGMLCSPLAWFDYVFFMAPPLLARKWDWRMYLVAVTAFLPVVWAIGDQFWTVVSGTVYLLAMLLLTWVVFFKPAQSLLTDERRLQAGAFAAKGT